MYPEDGLGQPHESSEAKMALRSCPEVTNVARVLYTPAQPALEVILCWGSHDLGRRGSVETFMSAMYELGNGAHGRSMWDPVHFGPPLV